jgi:hypothetical protein
VEPESGRAGARGVLWIIAALLLMVGAYGSDAAYAASVGARPSRLTAPDAKSAPLTTMPARRLKVCAVALNEPHELDVFRSHLDQSRFEFIDILAIAKSRAPADQSTRSGTGPWLVNACTSDTTCDVMIYSAEFAGRFFGKQGPSLSLQEMEEASCQARCAGLFHQPLEVFLLACNTLASKDEDSRTPEQYLQVLLDHGFDRSSAERVVELRYGPLGPSFRESLRRIFAGVPRIYGFTSVAPRGEYTAPMLSRYLQANPDYAGSLLTNARATTRNAALLSSFKGTSLAQTTGLTLAEAGALDRDHICALYDEQRSVADRLQIAYGFLLRPDALSFVPTLEVFLRRHPSSKFSPFERSIFTAIQALEAPRETVLKLVDSLNVSALKLELAHFAVMVGWLHPTELHAIAVNGAKQLLRQPLTAEVVDIMCEITKHSSLRGDFSADDIPLPVYRDAQGLRLLSCLAPSDRRVSPYIVPALRSTDWMTRQWAAYTLTRLKPTDEAVLEQLVPYIHDPDIGPRIRWLIQAQDDLPKGLRRKIGEIDPALLQTADAASYWRKRRAGDAPTASDDDPGATETEPFVTSR